MIRTLISCIFILVLAVPAVAAKPKDVYPVPCDDLWTAVKDTLANPGDYGVLAMDDIAQTALFSVTGATRVRINSVELIQQDKACQLKLTVKESGSGSESEDERSFRKHVDRSLARQQGAKPAKPAPTPGAQ